MKTKRKELDVDYIGDQTNLTKEEETIISNFIKEIKAKKSKRTSTKRKITKQLT